jgi:Tol biopolymer transport system component
LKKHLFLGMMMTAAIALAVTLAGCGGGEPNGPSTNPFKIVFASNRDGGMNIYSMNLNGSSRTPLTTDSTDSNGTTNSCPELSPNYTKVLYIKNTSINIEVRVVNIGGSNDICVTSVSDSAYNYIATWTPAGQILLWVYDGTTVSLKTFDPTANAIGNTWSTSGITSLSQTNIYAIWMSSKDNTILVSSASGIYELNVTGTTVSKQNQITIADVNSPGLASWSPDGNMIIFTDSDGTIYSAAADGSKVTTLASGYHGAYPFYTPDKTKIIFAGYDSHGSSTSYQIFSMSAGGTNINNLTNDGSNNVFGD